MNPVVFVLKGYPRLSETFISQEILALEQLGLPIHIVSLRHPTDKYSHPVHEEISAPVSYLPEYLHQEPRRVWRAVQTARALSGFTAAYNTWKRDLSRDRTRNRVRRFGQACVLATELPRGATHLHAHFLHTPASVARYAAMMLQIPWSCSAHAKDIYTSPDWELQEKLADCAWLVTCTATNAQHLKGLSANPDAVSLVYHGLDLERFPPMAKRAFQPDGSSNKQSVTILSVGRVVEKKGYNGLLHALAKLPENLHWRFVHIGGGSLTDTLRSLSKDLGLDQRIEWRGAQPQKLVLAAYKEAQIFALNSRIAGDGDRDGLPNVLMEAQSQQLACVATNVSAIPELIRDGETGILVPADDPVALCDALTQLITTPDKRAKLAKSGEKRVRESFALDKSIQDLTNRFGIGRKRC